MYGDEETEALSVGVREIVGSRERLGCICVFNVLKIEEAPMTVSQEEEAISRKKFQEDGR